jgi:tight adherence protein B
MTGIQISALAFFSIFAALRAITFFLNKDKEQIAKRIQTYTRDERISSSVGGEQKRERRRLFSALGALAPKKILNRAEQELAQTDIPLKAEELVVIQTVAVLLPIMASRVMPSYLFLAVVLALAGTFGPTIYIRQAKNIRLKKFNSQLGEALVVMSNSLRAGFSFLQALDSLKKEMPPPISTEFGRALQEMRLGTPTEEALINMTKRVRSDDLELIVTAVSIQRQVGGNLAEILDNIAFTIRERLRIKGELKTLTAQGRISGLIVGFLPLIMLVLIFMVNREYIMPLFTTTFGLIMLAAAVVSQCIGIAVIRRIVNIEY